MNFKLEFEPQPIGILNYRKPLLFLGSCFSENIGAKVNQLGINGRVNPFGVLYNPVSIRNCVERITEAKPFTADELVFDQGFYHSLQHHGSFAAESEQQLLDLLNSGLQEAHEFLASKPTLCLTLGSSWVYVHKGRNELVANCHKIPGAQFEKRLLSQDEIETALHYIANCGAFEQIILTVSPIRHVRDGLVENNRSKARLIEAVHSTVEQYANCHYFPAYEIQVDELRDYRFYKEDMLHPNQQAIDYIWSAFVRSAFDTESQRFIAEAEKLQLAVNHRTLFPDSEQSKRFEVQLQERIKTHHEKWFAASNNE